MNSRRRSRTTSLTSFDRTVGVKHPMLVHGAGIATIAAACTSAGNALALSVIMLALCCAMAMVYIFERGEYIRPMLTILYFVPAAFIACGCAMLLHLISPGTASGIGMYLPLVAADALVLARLQPESPFVSPSDSLPAAVSLWWLYAVMALPTGMVREILGSGRLFGFRLFFDPGVKGMEMTFAGFILLGFGLAIFNRMTRDR